MFPDSLNLSIRAPVNEFIQTLVSSYGWVFKAISAVILKAVLFIEWILRGLPWWVVILAFMALAWQSSKRWTLTVAVGALLFFVGVLGLWDLTMQTLALMLMATLVSVAIGVPMGILVAKSRLVRNITLPVLDVMQTMPSFVYLIPALMLFGLGKVPAILATIIYAVPPLIRLTDLGIRQVDHEVVEAATAFGGSPQPDPLRRRTAAGNPDDHGRPQPDNHDGAVDGGRRFDDRRARPRRAGAERHPDA